MDREFKHGVPESKAMKITPRMKKVYAFFDKPVVMVITCATILALLIIWRGGHAIQSMPPLR
jgi:hypothetical protein